MQCAFINGSPQNTFVPGCIELAEKAGVFIGGDDFKSGQTKLKSVLVDFLVSAGIKPVSIVSYNHLGNNDGKNLSAPQQFRSKEVFFLIFILFHFQVKLNICLKHRFLRVTSLTTWWNPTQFCINQERNRITPSLSNTSRMLVRETFNKN